MTWHNEWYVVAPTEYVHGQGHRLPKWCVFRHRGDRISRMFDTKSEAVTWAKSKMRSDNRNPGVVITHSEGVPIQAIANSNFGSGEGPGPSPTPPWGELLWLRSDRYLSG